MLNSEGGQLVREAGGGPIWGKGGGRWMEKWPKLREEGGGRQEMGEKSVREAGGLYISDKGGGRFVYFG